MEDVFKVDIFIINYICIKTPDNNSAVRKVNSDSSLAWMTAIGLFSPVMKSLSVDNKEQYVYFASFETSLKVWRLSANTGTITDAQVL